MISRLLLFPVLGVIICSIGLPASAQDFTIQKGGSGYTMKMEDRADAMSMSVDGSQIAIAFDGDKLAILKTPSGETIKYIEDFKDYLEDNFGKDLNLGSIRGMDYSATGKLALALIGGVILLDKNYQFIWFADGHQREIPDKEIFDHEPKTAAYGIRFLPNTDLLVTTSWEDGLIRLLNTTDGSEVEAIQTKQNSIRTLVVNDKGTHLAISGNNGTAVFEVSSRRQLWESMHKEAALCFEGAHVYLGSFFGISGLSKHDLATGSEIKMPAILQTYEISGLTLIADGRMVSTGETSKESPILVWTGPSGKEIAKVRPAHDPDDRIVGSKNASYVAIAGDDDEVRVYRVD